MNTNNNPQWTNSNGLDAIQTSKATLSSFMSRVFTWMTLALLVTAITAYFFANSPSLLGLLITAEGGMSILGWIVMFAPFGLVLLMGFGFQRMSRTALTGVFFTYSVLMGMSLSFILLAYTGSSIFTTFAITAGTFGVMAFLGYTTKTDLSKFGSILFMALIGIIIASLVNFFMHSGTLDYIISILGVLIFTGLTAYDVQKLKRIGSAVGEYQGIDTEKLSIMGALSLYLDFINLFLFLLRFLGDRR